jgi:hypothetical protein
MTTFVFLVNGDAQVHIVRVKVRDGEEEELVAEDIAERLGFSLNDAEWMCGRSIAVTTHYGIRKLEDAE